ncbi:hypothetical protein ACOSQ4_016769 [Xanthoceras sorbifolium]
MTGTAFDLAIARNLQSPPPLLLVEPPALACHPCRRASNRHISSSPLRLQSPHPLLTIAPPVCASIHCLPSSLSRLKLPPPSSSSCLKLPPPSSSSPLFDCRHIKQRLRTPSEL